MKSEEERNTQYCFLLSAKKGPYFRYLNEDLCEKCTSLAIGVTTRTLRSKLAIFNECKLISLTSFQ